MTVPSAVHPAGKSTPIGGLVSFIEHRPSQSSSACVVVAPVTVGLAFVPFATAVLSGDLAPDKPENSAATPSNQSLALDGLIVTVNVPLGVPILRLSWIAPSPLSGAGPPKPMRFV